MEETIRKVAEAYVHEELGRVGFVRFVLTIPSEALVYVRTPPGDPQGDFALALVYRGGAWTVSDETDVRDFVSNWTKYRPGDRTFEDANPVDRACEVCGGFVPAWSGRLRGLYARHVICDDAAEVASADERRFRATGRGV